MLKKLLAAVLALFAAAAFAAVDVNKADQAELEAVKGIGPSLSQRILDERKKGSFKDWSDLIARIRGVGPGNAARFSTGGLTVNGSAYAGAPAGTPGNAPSKAPVRPRSAASASAADAPPAPAPAAALARPASAASDAKGSGRR